MPTSTTGISTARFELDFNPVHIGQSFLEIKKRKFILSFHKIIIGISYKEVVSTIAFSISTNPATARIDELSRVIPASFIFLTSRTSPAEPQPFSNLRSNDIPQVII